MTGTVDRLRTGRWRRVEDRYRLASVALAAVVLDALTTYHVLAADGYREFNAVVSTVGAGEPALGAAYLLVHGGALAVAAWLSLGWVSTFCGTFAVATHGVAGGVSNLLLFTTGRGLYGVLPVGGGLAYDLTVVACLAVALAAAATVHDWPPLVEVVAVGCWFLGGLAVVADLL